MFSWVLTYQRQSLIPPTASQTQIEDVTTGCPVMGLLQYSTVTVLPQRKKKKEKKKEEKRND